MAENREPSQRQLRVGQEIKKIIAGEINLGEVRNLEGIDVLVTIVEASVSPDLKYCTVFFITTNSLRDEEVGAALQLAAGHFRKVVGKKTTLRYVPEFTFKVDHSFEQVDKIEKLLQDPKVKADLSKKSEEAE